MNSIGCAANRPLSEELSRQFAAIPPLGSRATIVMISGGKSNVLDDALAR